MRRLAAGIPLSTLDADRMIRDVGSAPEAAGAPDVPESHALFHGLTTCPGGSALRVRKGGRSCVRGGKERNQGAAILLDPRWDR